MKKGKDKVQTKITFSQVKRNSLNSNFTFHPKEEYANNSISNENNQSFRMSF